MKKKHFILLFLLALLFSSCSLFQNTAFEKRKYTPGFFVNTSSAEKSEAGNKIVSQQPVNKKENTVSHHEAKVAGVPAEKPSENKKITLQKIVTAVVSKEIKTEKGSSFKQKIENKIEQKVSSLTAKRESQRQMEGIDGETILLLAIVLLLTALYTAEILSEAPDMPIGLAILLALLCSIISILTGQILII